MREEYDEEHLMKKLCYTVKLLWDKETDVWVALSEDIKGLTMESDSVDILIERVRGAVSELLKLNHQRIDATEISFKTERIDDICNKKILSRDRVASDTEVVQIKTQRGKNMLQPELVSVSPEEGYKLLLSYKNGEKRIFDVAPYICGSWFGELKDPGIFKRVRVSHHTVEWEHGQDIAPHELYNYSTLVSFTAPIS